MERIRLGYRCTLRWQDLDGNDPHQRRCGQCDKTVLNLSSLTRPEAERLLAARVRDGGRVCVRFVQGADGRVEYAQPIAVAARRRLPLLGAAAALATMVALPRAATADLSSPPKGKPAAPATTIRRPEPQKAPPPRPSPPKPAPPAPPQPPVEEWMGDYAE